MRPLLLLLATAATIALPGPAAGDPAHPDGAKNLAWDCERLDVETSQTSVEALTLFLPERSVPLTLAPSASGSRYQGEGVMFWTKGSEQALLEHGGEAYRCSVDVARSVWTDAKLRGVEFRGVGNEPGWVLELEAERLVFVYDYGTRRLEIPRPEADRDVEAGRTVYTTEADAWPLTLTLRQEPCSDVMSGAAFEATVEIRWGPQRFDGCGRSLR